MTQFQAQMTLVGILVIGFLIAIVCAGFAIVIYNTLLFIGVIMCGLVGIMAAAGLTYLLVRAFNL